ncbi:hypothetical protein JW964_09180 [candidate division KSB1 bacterium]|nr:hypothetical protein [candidate division KSB1 bacterium]
MADPIPDYVTKGEFNTFKQEVFDKFAEVATKKDLELVKQDVAELKKDVSGLKQDVSGLKQDVAGLKQDVAGLKQDVAGLKHDVAGLKQDNITLKRDTTSLKEDMAFVKNEIASLNTRYDKMSKNIDWLMNEAMLSREKWLEVDKLNEKMNTIISMIDSIARTMDTMRQEMHVQNLRQSRTNKKVNKLNQYRKVSDQKIEDHEYRINKLENKKPK